jgi:hypothetical protein
MIVSVYLTLFAVAALATYITISRRIDERLGGVIATIMWARLTPAAFNLTVFSGGSELSAPADGATAILTATLAITMAVFTIGYAFEYVPELEQTRFNRS